jgi:hypothetical protein
VALVQPLVVVPKPCAAELSMLWSSLVLTRMQQSGLHSGLPTGMMPPGAAQLVPGPPSRVGMAPWRLQITLGGQTAVMPVLPELISSSWQQVGGAVACNYTRLQ